MRMKLLAALAIIVVILNATMASAQTSSRFRNEVTNNVNQHSERINTACVSTANRQYHAQPSVRLLSPSTWGYKYEEFFLNECLFAAKMQVMNRHIQQSQTRIARLQVQARNRRDAFIANSIQGRQRGLVAFRNRQAASRPETIIRWG